MKGSDFEKLPPELIIHCMNLGNLKSIFQMRKTCSQMNKIGSNQVIWLRLCSIEPKAKALIHASGIEEELIKGIIDPAVFFNSLLRQEVATLKLLLFPHQQSRMFLLWTPSNASRTASFFGKTPEEIPRTLFLSKEIGKQELLKTYRARHWHSVKVFLDDSFFDQLLTNQKISYAKPIELEPLHNKMHDFNHK